ncbi:2-keto-4-pentenoate hydratase [Hirschia baltica ATCC 49814]|uniref:2-keto-4-pentenoate hydratase n=2 Tax=Hirschia TaxID=2723 RepID=C6XQW1_HIRBI|nr:2-keto-4-pentenoate hydratase [Hirschia baltica ATCC 49814]
MTPVSFDVQLIFLFLGKLNMSSTQSTQNPAHAIVDARQRTGFIEQFPTPIAADLETAYAYQDTAIDMVEEKIVGWKIGRIVGDDVEKYGTDRLFGPIFESKIYHDKNEVTSAPVFSKGFAAVESEIIFEVAADTPADKTEWTTQEAIDYIANAYVGIEVASSPFTGINDNGPLVTITDLGNNYGLIVGEPIEDWKSLDCEKWTFDTLIEGEVIGTGNAAGIPGTPVESLRALLENTAKRGRPLKKGMLITTGAVTGVHSVKVGQAAIARFQNKVEIACTFKAQNL